MNYGFKMSKLKGNEPVLSVSDNITLPLKYSYQNFLPPVYDQGNEPWCVPYSLSTHLNWNHNIDTDGNVKRENYVEVKDIYKMRKNIFKDDGMSFLEALDYLKKKGVKCKNGRMKIRGYAKVTSAMSLKYALLMNGPCVGALRVYNDSDYFWRREYQGQEMIGGHAIAIVGYDEENFIIRNSWGKSWGFKGYTYMPFSEVSKFLEIWTIYD